MHVYTVRVCIGTSKPAYPSRVLGQNMDGSSRRGVLGGGF